MCAAAISFARIRRVYFAAHDPKGGAVEMASASSTSRPATTRPEVYGGIRERRGGGLLRELFRGAALGPHAGRNACRASSVAPGFSSATKWPDDHADAR